ncbi:MAG: hypothetical protein GY820_04220 [Gammaproteobacteria bacterium]|nr:hypothetical protein [Gammaproteobacteria bacterium]
MRIRGLILLGLLCTLQACGFQLRGFSTLPEQFSNLRVITNDLSQTQQRELNLQLLHAGAKLNYDVELQSAILTVSVESLAERNIVDSAGSDRTIVRITRQLSYSLSDSAGKRRVDNKTLLQNQDLELDNNNLLGIEYEKLLAKENLDKALFNSLLIQLRGL